ncbi:hypothetical protein [Anaeromyxobacter terrae]|uniref:hypothetical protein n=1 Tax=Anaeromyxobacter terrae TaxID=2925406 RepID=UPI001F5AAA87|nr:hypothetical protein [Anaeromyxobacter sp. SG22]
MPPRTLGDRGHLVRVAPLEGRGFAVTVDGGALAATFSSEPEARAAASAEALRLDAVAGALLRRLRRGLRRKQ